LWKIFSGTNQQQPAQSMSQRLAFKQKILLFSVGIFAALIALELVLRLGGLVFATLQERQNQSGSSSGEFRILCIGESTTALGGENSYPYQLEEMLKKARPDLKVKVINKGLVSKTSADILAALPGYLNRYQPNLVVAMIGINDLPDVDVKNPLAGLWRTLARRVRVIHLFDLISAHLQSKFVGAGTKGRTPAVGAPPPVDEEKKVFNSAESVREFLAPGMQMLTLLQARLAATKVESERQALAEQIGKLRIRQSWLYVTLGHYYLIRDNCQEAMPQYQQALTLDSKNYGAYVELGQCYEKQGRCDVAVNLFERAYIIDPEAILGGMGLGRCYDTLGQQDKARAIFAKLMKNDKDLFKARQDIGDWFAEHKYFSEAEVVFRKALAEHPDDYLLYGRLAGVLEQTGRAAEAAGLRQKEQTLSERADGYLPETRENYQRIADMILKRGITLVCMQYPMRALEPLTKVLSGRTGIIFVSNRNNFQQALATAEYNDYFSDSFAGYFGHCTRRGNRLIAENLSRVILDKGMDKK